MSPAPKWILVAEDDRDDFLLLRDAFQSVAPAVELRCVPDGEAALNVLHEAVLAENSLPIIVILDLNMPRKDGREVLKEIRATEPLQYLPVILFTNSDSREEASEVYALGANTFIRKPFGFAELKQFVQIFCRYWLQHAKLI